MEEVLVGRAVVAGSAEGRAIVSGEPLSFWGGFEPETGEIIDRRHDRSGAVISGRIFVFPFSKGSSTGSRSLLEGIRAGTAPAAIINVKVDPILALGSILGDEFYGKTVPIVTLPEQDFGSIKEGDHLAIEPDGTVRKLE
jgi:predicted aconitase with swiveling domain